MKISDLIEMLRQELESEGDVEIRIHSDVDEPTDDILIVPCGQGYGDDYRTEYLLIRNTVYP